jgi:ferrous iron transport protein B
MAGCCDGCTILKKDHAKGCRPVPGSREVRRFTVALAGNPNSGKTTLFNGLTGLRQKVANYAGVTVEKKIGLCRVPDGAWIDVIDLPGSYSLVSQSPDEQVAMEVLRGMRSDTPAPDAIIAVVDASNLQRNLYLVSQIIEMGRPLVVALNMVDVAERRGVRVDAGALERRLGVPVVPVVGHKRSGIPELLRAIGQARVAPVPDWPIRMRVAGIDPMQADIEAHYGWIEEVVADCQSPALVQGVVESPPHQAEEARAQDPTVLPIFRPPTHLSERIDSFLIHRVWGLIAFAFIMGSMFAAMFWLAKPIQSTLSAFIGMMGNAVASHLPGDALQSLVRDGIFAGVGSVIVFVPQIAILFLFLAVLEDSGYLSRAAFLMDRLLSRVGLHGKSFIPLLSGFACAIPAIMATRTIERRRSRLATILVLPFMTCSARLPVYGLLVGTFFAAYGSLVQAGVMLGLYVLGIVFAAAVALVFRRTFLRGQDSGFILELPTYKVPQPSVVGRQVWSNSRQFLTRAGTTIFMICLVLWAISYYPRLPHDQAERLPDVGAQAAAQRSYSFAGRLGRTIEPGIRPLGFDWKIGVACIGAFAAREVFVSTLAIVHGTGTDDREENLAASMQADRYPDGRKVWTPLVTASVLLWFVLAMQCLSTVMVVRQETGGWRWPVFMLVYMNALAYVACLFLYQVGSRVWGG